MYDFSIVHTGFCDGFREKNVRLKFSRQLESNLTTSSRLARAPRFRKFSLVNEPLVFEFGCCQIFRSGS